MKNVRRLALAILLTVGTLAGCPDTTGTPTTTPPTSSEPGTLTFSVTAPDMANTGETITITADLPEGTDAASVFFEWFQTYGRQIDLAGASDATLTFTAPSFGQDETVGFRLDVKDSAGRVSSDSFELTIMADPAFNTTGDPTDPGDTITDPGDPTEDPRPVVRIITSRGAITVELNRTAAPISVANFLQYVDDGFYDGLIFHRVIPDFVVQGGGFTDDLEQVDTRPAITNEADNGLDNDRGTIAMARTNNPNSATSQFYFNLIDNDSLNAREGFAGYAVFGRITDGLEVIDEIALEETSTQNGFQDVPVTTIRIFTIERRDGTEG